MDILSYCRSVMALSADVICGKIAGLTTKQRQLCASKPDTMVAISNGAKLGLAECEEQFKFHRWNCTALGSNRNGFGHVVVYGTDYFTTTALSRPTWPST